MQVIKSLFIFTLTSFFITKLDIYLGTLIFTLVNLSLDIMQAYLRYKAFQTKAYTLPEPLDL